MTKHKEIDLSMLGEADKHHLRAVLTTATVPDGVRRFCVSAMFPDDPELSTMVQDIKEGGVPAMEEFILRANKQYLRDLSFSQVVGLPLPDAEWHFGLWLTRLVQHNTELLPECGLKHAMAQAVELRDKLEEGCDGNCQDCPTSKPNPNLN